MDFNATIKERRQEMFLDVYNRLKTKDFVYVQFGNAIAKDNAITLMVTSPHRIVGKSKVGRIILKRPDNLGGMRWTLYNRDGHISLAQGDMATNLYHLSLNAPDSKFVYSQH